MEPLTTIGGGYGATKLAMTKTLEQIGGKMALGLMVGGGKKRKSKQSKRRKQSKRTKRISRSRISSIKKMYTRYKKKKRIKKQKKTKKARKDIIKSIEYGTPISKKSFNSLTPSMKSFLAGIESGSRTGSTIHFSDFKSVPNKKKKKKTNSRPRTRGGSRPGRRSRCRIHKGGCDRKCYGRQ